MDVYLIEARSIGGISGSPVFVRGTLNIPGRDSSSGKPQTIHGISGDYYLLGLIHGHWDIRESELNEPSFIHDRQRGVNLGIGVVVPANKILEIIDHPQLVAARAANEAAIWKAISPGQDGE
jgi:hypothetical protein